MATSDEKKKRGRLFTAETAAENGRKGGIASGKAKRRKKSIKAGIKAMMEDAAPDQVKAAFSGAGYDVDDNHDAVVAAIIMGAIKGDPRMTEKVIELLGESERDKARKAELKIAKERLKIDQEKAALEAEKQRIWMETLKAQEAAQMEDDGFMEALKGTASEDWSDEDDR